MAVGRGFIARRLVPRTALVARVLETLDLSVGGRLGAYTSRPREPAAFGERHALNMSTGGGLFDHRVGTIVSVIFVQTLKRDRHEIAIGSGVVVK